jgi:twin arginine-targeting protein translocase, TatA/E family
MSVGPWQILLILLIILVLFGAGKIPTVMRDLAKGIQAFKKGMREEEEKKDTPEHDAHDKKRQEKKAYIMDASAYEARAQEDQASPLVPETRDAETHKKK